VFSLRRCINCNLRVVNGHRSITCNCSTRVEIDQAHRDMVPLVDMDGRGSSRSPAAAPPRNCRPRFHGRRPALRMRMKSPTSPRSRYLRRREGWRASYCGISSVERCPIRPRRCPANCTGSAGLTSCCASSTCTRPAARGSPRRPNMSGGCSPSAATAAAPSRPGPTSTTGRSPTCRASPRAGFWSSRTHGAHRTPRSTPSPALAGEGWGGGTLRARRRL